MYSFLGFRISETEFGVLDSAKIYCQLKKTGNFTGFIIKALKTDRDCEPAYILAILELPTRLPRGMYGCQASRPGCVVAGAVRRRNP